VAFDGLEGIKRAMASTPYEVFPVGMNDSVYIYIFIFPPLSRWGALSEYEGK
jgi:hypothetical protein